MSLTVDGSTPCHDGHVSFNDPNRKSLLIFLNLQMYSIKIWFREHMNLHVSSEEQISNILKKTSRKEDIKK